MTSPQERRSAFSMISRGPFARMWWASVISSGGDWITIFATIAVADNIAGGPGTLVAIVSRILPGLIFGAFAGVVTDRVDRRLLIVVSDVGRGLLVPLLIFADNLPLLVAINLGLEMLSLLSQAPRAAVIPRLVAEENIVTGNSLLLGASYGTIPLGAAFNWAFAALPAITLWGLVPPGNRQFALAFLLDSVTFIASGLLVATLPALRAKVERRDNAGDVAAPGSQSTLRDLLDGARFLWTERSVRRVIVALATALFGGGVIVVLGKRFVEEVLDADAVGFFAIVTAVGAGAAVGIAAVSLYSSRLRQRDLVFGLAAILTGLGLGAAALTATVAGASLWIFVFGFGAGAGYVMGFTHLHESVGDELRGRVFSAMFALMRIGLFVSMGVAVPLEGLLRRSGLGVISQFPTRSILVFGAAFIVLAGLAVVWPLRGILLRPDIDPEARKVFEEAARAARRRSRRSGRGKRG